MYKIELFINFISDSNAEKILDKIPFSNSKLPEVKQSV
jgi:hypothetical protein